VKLCQDLSNLQVVFVFTSKALHKSFYLYYFTLLQTLHKSARVLKVFIQSVDMLVALRFFLGVIIAAVVPLYIVLDGEMSIAFPDGKVDLKKGEMVVVPRGAKHKPIADNKCKIMVIAYAGTLNTGDAGGDMTDR
jgi:hypothetical protein